MSKLTTITASLIVALAAFSVQAQQTLTPGQYCNIMANYAEAVALDRDNGTPEYRALDLASQHHAPNVRSDLIFVVQVVHSEPYVTPSQEASVIFEVCWANYGEA